MNPHDRNYPPVPDPSYLLFRLGLYTIFGACCFLIGHWAGEHKGYSAAKSEAKVCPAPKAMTDKQALRHTLWMMRDKGAIK